MEATKYVELGTDWQSDKTIECCTKTPPDPSGCCDCCYDSWVTELKKVRQDYSRVSENAKQLSDEYNLTAAERDKLKSWLDDLIKTDQLSMALCDQFAVLGSQVEKICTNAEKTVEAIGILFCMIRDFYEQVDQILIYWNQIDNCIKCLNSEDLPEGSGIRKCLKNYKDKLDALIKTRNDLLKAIMTAIATANALHAGICSDYGLDKVISDWEAILNCGSTASAPTDPVDPCKDMDKTETDATENCKLIPILTFPIAKDPHYIWVNDKYNKDVDETIKLAAKLVEANKKKEGLAACQSSLIEAIKQVDPKELCK
jgi:hypothetical protein